MPDGPPRRDTQSRSTRRDSDPHRRRRPAAAAGAAAHCRACHRGRAAQLPAGARDVPRAPAVRPDVPRGHPPHPSRVRLHRRLDARLAHRPDAHAPDHQPPDLVGDAAGHRLGVVVSRAQEPRARRRCGAEGRDHLLPRLQPHRRDVPARRRVPLVDRYRGRTRGAGAQRRARATPPGRVGGRARPGGADLPRRAAEGARRRSAQPVAGRAPGRPGRARPRSPRT